MKASLNPSLQWLPEMRDNDGKPCLKEVDAMKRMIEINQEWSELFHLPPRAPLKR